jgi:hypothetical protein
MLVTAPIMARSYHNFYDRTCFRLWFQVRYISKVLYPQFIFKFYFKFGFLLFNLVYLYGRYAVWVPAVFSQLLGTVLLRLPFPGGPALPYAYH